ncbi:aggregation-promoting factor C-terminal-like domain-containing protein [Nocardioides sambongensis]|uniref:aggregation-promoting factor C-terminal-like domain-containing protein n=1 Tax=Nocardioides sambongensis TaxID=2589074 RepID=UPI0015E85AB4|nr:transglycosylase SLT domain-containing protein [Nocardioides sambongensis]
MPRGAGARAAVGTAALACLSLLGCAPAQEAASPAAPTAPVTSADPDPSSPDASDASGGSAGPTGRERTGAAAQVPDAVILEELRRTAERIAQRLPSAEPTLLPTDVAPDSNRGLGYRLMLDFGFDRTQWPYLDALWHRESGWNHLAENPSSGAYGIPQSLPGTKMAVVGPDWRSNPETQIRWGLAYIAARYGNPEGAWAHSERVNWY